MSFENPKMQKLRMKETERILDKLIGGVFTSFSSREKFFQRMGRAGVPPLKMDITRSKIIKTIKTEVKNNQLEPTEENIDKRLVNSLINIKIIQKPNKL